MRYSMRVITWVLLLLAAAAGTVAMAGGVTDQVGRSVRVPDDPRRVVSLADRKSVV